MTDIEIAKEKLAGHSIVLCKDKQVLTSDKKGIAPMIDYISAGYNLKGFSVADVVVGKAVAMLFVLAKVKEVFAKTISKGGADFLQSHKIPFSYDVLADKIINRKGDDICPMEKVVLGVEDINQAYLLIKAKLEELKSKND